MRLSAVQPDERASLYAPLEYLQVRLPLLPVEAYASAALQATQLLHGTATSPEHAIARLALSISSPALLDALERRPHTQQSGASLHHKLWRYLVRMCTRPTPFGLCAGVALATWGATTQLSTHTAARRTRTRLDMGWLLNAVLFLEIQPQIQKHLRFSTNSAVLISAGRAFLEQRAATYGSAEKVAVSVRATPVVQHVLAAAQTPIAYDELLTQIYAISPNASASAAEQLIAQLVEHTLLLSDLRPPLTIANPAQYVIQGLAAIPGCQALAAELRALHIAASSADEQSPEESLGTRQRIQIAINHLPLPATHTPLQTDSLVELHGRQLHRRIAGDVAQAAELLLQLSPYPDGWPHIVAYRHAFAQRYPLGREVPLLELVNAECGLGLPARTAEMNSTAASRRAEALLRIAALALHRRQSAVELDASLLADLATNSLAEATLPGSLELFIAVAAPSAADVDSGNYQIVIGPNTGTSQAGRSTGRFADMLGDAALALLQTQPAEQFGPPDVLFAELSYLPDNGRHANVMVHPSRREYQLCYGTSPSGPPHNAIPFHELLVGLRDGRFYLCWQKTGQELRVCTGHMVQPDHAPGLCRFLSEISRDGQAQLVAFDWGPAEIFPFLPRLSCGRIVLHLARWRIDADTRARELSSATLDGFRTQLEQWRAAWRVPSHVYLRRGDQRLLLDLGDELHIEALRRSLHHVNARLPIILQEALPGLDHAWLPGPQGHFLAEFVVPLQLRSAREQAGAPATSSGESHRVTTSKGAPTALRPGARQDRHEALRPPGSDWLFVKLYCGSAAQDDLLSESLWRFVRSAVQADLADQWFFVRYADPEPHLRLRFHGKPAHLIEQLVPRVSAWANELLADRRCRHWGITTYDREVERYGGPLGMTLAEQFFAADSEITLAFLRLLRRPTFPLDRIGLALLSLYELLDDFELTAAYCRLWRQNNPAAWRRSAQLYRERGQQLRLVLKNQDWLEQHLENAAASNHLQAYRRERARVSAELREAERQAAWTQPLLTLAESFVHMHCNRLMGTDRTLEELVLGLLARLWNSLRVI